MRDQVLRSCVRASRPRKRDEPAANMKSMQGIGSRQPPPAAAAVHLNSLDAEYDSEDDMDEQPGSPRAAAADGEGGGGSNGGGFRGGLPHAAPPAGETPAGDTPADASVTNTTSDGSGGVAAARLMMKATCTAGRPLDADGDVVIAERSFTQDTVALPPASDAGGGGGGGCARGSDCGDRGGRGGGLAAAAARPGAAHASRAAVATAGDSPACQLAAMTSLERLRLYDDPGALPVDQEAAKVTGRWPWGWRGVKEWKEDYLPVLDRCRLVQGGFPGATRSVSGRNGMTAYRRPVDDLRRPVSALPSLMTCVCAWLHGTCRIAMGSSHPCGT